MIDININNLAKNQVSAVFHSWVICRSLSPKFIDLCMETPCLCPSEGHRHSGHIVTETSVTELSGVSITLIISGHWRCNRRLWPLKGPQGPFPLKSRSSEMRFPAYWASKSVQHLKISVVVVLFQIFFFITGNIIFIFINEIETDGDKRSYRWQ